MTPRLRPVFDTNVLVSAAIFTTSVPRRALIHSLRHGSLLMSEELAKEVRGVLTRARFDRHATREVREEFLRNLMLDVEFVTITETVQACRDPNDDKILELAVNGRADYIVTGDNDLLVMDPFRGITIIRPAEFLAFVGAEQE